MLELLTSDWRSYLNKVITGLKKLALTKTNDSFLKEECYKKISLIQEDIKKDEYPWYITPFDKIEHASLLLTNIHILELDYLNQNTVKAVKNMLRTNFKDIYNPEIYISTRYADYTYGSLKHTCTTEKLDSKLVKEISNIINFIYQFYFADYAFTQHIILSMATRFKDLQNFYQNSDTLNFLVPLQKYNLEYQTKDYKSFINIETITWNRFLVKYQKLFNNLSEEHSEILFSICSDNEEFIKLLISDYCHLSLNKRSKIIEYLIDKYKENAESIYPTAVQLFNICDDKDGLVQFLTASSYNLSLQKRVEIIEYLIGKYKNDIKSIYYITEQLFNICNDNTGIKTIETKVKHFNKYIKHSRSWDGLPSYWHINFKGLPGCDTEALIMGDSVKLENDFDNI